MCPLSSTLCPTRHVGQLPPQHPDGETSNTRLNLSGWPAQGPLQKSDAGQGSAGPGYNQPGLRPARRSCSPSTGRAKAAPGSQPSIPECRHNPSPIPQVLPQHMSGGGTSLQGELDMTGRYSCTASFRVRGQQHPPMEQTCRVVERANLGGINQCPSHGDVHFSHGECTLQGNGTMPRKPNPRVDHS